MSLDALRVFQRVAELGSFSRAAEKLGKDKSQVSRVVRQLEAELGTALFARTTRAVRLTAEGEGLFQRLAPHLAGVDAAVSAVPERSAAASGQVHLATTPDLGRVLLAPLLAAFRRRHPLVRVRLSLGQDVVDLTAEGVDLALRVGRPGGQEVVARKLGELGAGFFAAPAYLDRRGAPRELRELAEHDGLWPEPAPGQRSFMPAGRVPPPAVVCADFQALAELARSGAGIALLPTFLAAADVERGALVRVVPAFVLRGAPLYLVSRPTRPLPARVTLLREHLLAARWRLEA